MSSENMSQRLLTLLKYAEIAGLLVETLIDDELSLPD